MSFTINRRSPVAVAVSVYDLLLRYGVCQRIRLFIPCENQTFIGYKYLILVTCHWRLLLDRLEFFFLLRYGLIYLLIGLDCVYWSNRSNI